MVSSKKKFCKDCQYARRSLSDWMFFFGSYRFAKCHHPGSLYQDRSGDGLVTGEQGKARYSYCSTMRDLSAWCGTAGRWFEQKREKR